MSTNDETRAGGDAAARAERHGTGREEGTDREGDRTDTGFRGSHDLAPGEEEHGETSLGAEVRGYVVGFGLAALLTAASFYAAGSGLIWAPGIPVALVALAVAQMGVHLVFFLHVTSGPDNANNVLALAFGVLIVALVLIGSIWIMAHLNHNLMNMDELMRMQR